MTEIKNCDVFAVNICLCLESSFVSGLCCRRMETRFVYSYAGRRRRRQASEVLSALVLRCGVLFCAAGIGSRKLTFDV